MALPQAAGFPAPTPFPEPQPVPYFGLTSSEQQLASAVPGLTPDIPTTTGVSTGTPFTQTQEQYGFLQTVTGDVLGDGNDPRKWGAAEAASQTDAALAKIGAVNPDLAQQLAAQRNPQAPPEDGDGFLQDVLHAAGTVLGLPVIKQVFDVLSRPAHIIPEILADEENQGIWGNVAQALAGESDKGWGQVLDKYGVLQGDDFMSKLAHNALAFAGDVATDPLTYLTLGGGAVGREAIGMAAGKASVLARIRKVPEAMAVVEKAAAEAGTTVPKYMESLFAHTKGIGQLGAEGGSTVGDHLNQILGAVHSDIAGGVLHTAMGEAEMAHMGELLRLFDNAFTATTTGGWKSITTEAAERMGFDKGTAEDILGEVIGKGRFSGKPAYQQAKAAAGVLGQPRFNFALPGPFNLRYAGKRILPFNLPFNDLAGGRRFFAGLSGNKRAMKMFGAGEISEGELRALWQGGFREFHKQFPEKAQRLAGGSFLHGGSILYPLSDAVGGLTAQLSTHSKVLRGGGLAALTARDASNRARQMVEDVSVGIHNVTNPTTGKQMTKGEWQEHVITTLRVGKKDYDPTSMERITEYVNALPGPEARAAAASGNLDKWFADQINDIDTQLRSGTLSPSDAATYRSAKRDLLQGKARAKAAAANMSDEERTTAGMFGDIMDKDAEVRAKAGLPGDAYDPETVAYGNSVHIDDAQEFQEGAHEAVNGKLMRREGERATDPERLTEAELSNGELGRGHVLYPDDDLADPTRVAAASDDAVPPAWADPARNPHVDGTEEVLVNEVEKLQGFKGDLTDYDREPLGGVDRTARNLSAEEVAARAGKSPAFAAMVERQGPGVQWVEATDGTIHPNPTAAETAGAGLLMPPAAPTTKKLPSELFADDVAKNGVREPLVVQYNPETGEALLVDGNHRLNAAKLAGHSHVPVRIEVVGQDTLSPLERATYDAEVARGQSVAKALKKRKGPRDPNIPTSDELAAEREYLTRQAEDLVQSEPTVRQYDEVIAQQDTYIEAAKQRQAIEGETERTTAMVTKAREAKADAVRMQKEAEERTRDRLTKQVDEDMAKTAPAATAASDSDEVIALQNELFELTGHTSLDPTEVVGKVRAKRGLVVEQDAVVDPIVAKAAQEHVDQAKIVFPDDPVHQATIDRLGLETRPMTREEWLANLDSPAERAKFNANSPEVKAELRNPDGSLTAKGRANAEFEYDKNGVGNAAHIVTGSSKAGRKGAKVGAKLKRAEEMGGTKVTGARPVESLPGSRVVAPGAEGAPADVIPPTSLNPSDVFPHASVGRTARPRRYVANVRNPASEQTARAVREEVLAGKQMALDSVGRAAKKGGASQGLKPQARRAIEEELLDEEQVSTAVTERLKELGHDGVAHEDGKVTVFHSAEGRNVKRVTTSAPRSARKHGNVTHTLTDEVEQAVGRTFGRDRAGAARLLSKLRRETIGRGIKEADAIMRRKLAEAGVDLAGHQAVLENDILKLTEKATTRTGADMAGQFMGRVGRRIDAFGWGKSALAGDAVGINRFKYVVADGHIEALARAGEAVQRSAERAANIQSKTLGPQKAEAEHLAQRLESIRVAIADGEHVDPDDIIRLTAANTRAQDMFEKGTMEAKAALDEHNKALTRLQTTAAKAEPALIPRENAVNRAGLENLAEFPGFEDTFVPTFVAEEMRRAAKGYGGFTGFHKEYRKFMSWWKSWATYMFPGFHARNMQGAWFNNFLGGVDLGDHIFASRIRRAAHEVTHTAEDKWKWAGQKMATKDAKHLREMGLDKLYGDQVFEWTYDDFAKLSSDMGVNAAHGRAFGEARIGAELMEARANQHFIEKSPFKSRYLRPGEAYVKGMKGAGTMTENLFRTAAFVRGLKTTGGDVSGARAFMMMRHGDYADLTDFEHGFVRDVLPFYKWMRTNTPLQIHQLLESPGKLLAVSKARDAAWATMGQDYDKDKYKIPEWMRDSLSIPLGSGDAFNLVMMDLPMSDMFINGREFVSSFLPMVRPLLESYALGKTTFTGKELTGEAVPLSPFFAPISPLLNAVGVTEKGADGQTYVDDKMANLLTAIPAMSRFTSWMYEDDSRVRSRSNAIMSGIMGVGLRKVDEETMASNELDFYYSQVVPAMDHMRSLGYQLPTVDDVQSMMGSTDAVLQGLGIQPGELQYAA